MECNGIVQEALRLLPLDRADVRIVHASPTPILSGRLYPAASQRRQAQLPNIRMVQFQRSARWRQNHHTAPEPTVTGVAPRPKLSALSELYMQRGRGAGRRNSENSRDFKGWSSFCRLGGVRQLCARFSKDLEPAFCEAALAFFGLPKQAVAASSAGTISAASRCNNMPIFSVPADAKLLTQKASATPARIRSIKGSVPDEARIHFPWSGEPSGWNGQSPCRCLSAGQGRF
jgi:hypothetical protein